MKERYEEISDQRKLLIEEITKLTEEWYLLINKGHHKDRDCHWYIETKWSYGHEPTYTVQHFGYVIHPEIEIEHPTYGQALVGLKELLTQHIAEEKKNQKERETHDW